MKKLYEYQVVQKYLIDHYNTYGKYASVGEILPEIKEYSMLSNTRLPISKVAENAGYPTQNHFSRAFRKEMGTTPTDYRNECQKMHNPS